MCPSCPRCHQRTELSGGRIGLAGNARSFRHEKLEVASLPRTHKQRNPAKEVKLRMLLGEFYSRIVALALMRSAAGGSHPMWHRSLALQWCPSP